MVHLDEDEFEVDEIKEQRPKNVGYIALFAAFVLHLKAGTIKPQQVREAVQEKKISPIESVTVTTTLKNLGKKGGCGDTDTKPKHKPQRQKRRWGLTDEQISAIADDPRNWAEIALDYHIPILRVRYIKGR